MSTVSSVTATDPRGRTRWQVAAVAFLSTGVTVGLIQYGSSVFIEPLDREFGWTRTQINISLSLGFVSALSAPFWGRLMDRIGAKPVMVASLSIMAVGFLMRATMTELWHWYALSALIALGVPGATILPSGRLVSLWFPHGRGKIMGLVVSGNNAGGILMVPLLTMMVVAQNWRWGFTAAGISLAITAIAAIVLVREPPLDDTTRAGSTEKKEAHGAASITMREITRSRTFVLIAVGLTASSFTHPLVLTQLIPHLENEGLSKEAAASALVISAAVALFSKIGMGWLSDHITARLATVLSLLIISVGIGIIIAVGDTWVVWPGVFVFGLGLGGFGALRALVVAETYGPAMYGRVMGLITALTVISVVSGPLVAGQVFDATGSYRPAFAAAIGIFLVGAVALTLARRNLANQNSKRTA
ncbi:MAG: MFS transporter [Dehalococcoidia bacterium]